MSKFTQAAATAVALSTVEMKNVKGGGNCAYQFRNPEGYGSTTECGLNESDYDAYADLNGQWCCSDCASQGVTC